MLRPRFIYLSILLLTIVVPATTQGVLQLLPSHPSFADYEKLSIDISKDANLDQKKGWKWISRWVHDQERMIGPDGKLPLHRDYESGLKGYQEFKTKAAQSSLRNSTWSPAGPNDKPDPAFDYLIPGTGRINTITFHPTDKNIMWCGGGQGGIFKTTNGGQSWTPIGDNLPVMHVSDIAVDPNDTDVMYVCVGDYAYIGIALELDNRKRFTHYGMGVYKTIDGGQNWEPTGLSFELTEKDMSLTRRVLINHEDSQKLVAFGVQGIWTSENGGTDWKQVNTSVMWDAERDPSNPNTIYASTGYIGSLGIGQAGILKSTDFGQTWETLNTGIPEVGSVQRVELAISPIDPSYVFAVACNMNEGLYGFYRSTNGGTSWELRSTSPNILHWYEGNGTGGQGTYDLTILADPVDPDVVYVSGVNNWVSENGGQDWSGTSYWIADYGPSVHADHHFLAYNPLDEYVYLCNDGGVSRTKKITPGSWEEAFMNADYTWPTTWEHINNGMANLSFYRLSVSQTTPGNVYSGAQDMGTFLRDTNHWTYRTLGDGMECIIHPENDNILYGSSQYGNIFKSEDRGQSFQSLGGYGPRPWGQELAAWTTPFLLHPQNPETIFIAAQNLWRSDDGGFDFTQVSNLENIAAASSLSICEANPEHMYMAKRIYHSFEIPSQMLTSADGGSIWTDITSGLPDSLFFIYSDVDDDDPLHAWVTCSGFVAGVKVFETKDGGSSWINISRNLPNFPANCIRHHSGTANNALYVGLDRGIYYTNDEMNEWQLYSEGLPNVVISELEIQWNSEKLYASTFGRGIWINDLIDQTQVKVQDALHEIDFQVFPNVTKGPFTLQLNDLLSQDLYFEIVDQMGRIMHVEKIPPGNQFVKAYNPGLLSGQYYLRLHSGNAMQVKKLIVVD